MSETKARVLVVDDELMNRELIRGVLGGTGYDVVVAETGAEAIEVVASSDIDLVLLDVLMPGVDGFETMRMLKTAHVDRVLPIVLVTALSDRESRRRGLEGGADDFLTKPIDGAELVLRVNNLLALAARDRALRARNAELESLREFREAFAGFIVHDLKSPLTTTLASLEYVVENASKLDAEALSALRDARSSADRMVTLVTDLLQLHRIETLGLEVVRSRVHLADLLRRAAGPRKWEARRANVRLSVQCSESSTVLADRALLTRVLENLADNALRHVRPGGQVEVRGRTELGLTRIEVANDGPAVEQAARASIFERYQQGRGRTAMPNLGIGLHFSRVVVEAHGGRIWVEEQERYPTVFCIEIP